MGHKPGVKLPGGLLKELGLSNARPATAKQNRKAIKPPGRKSKIKSTASEDEDFLAKHKSRQPKIPRRTLERLEEDDAEIAALERKLGIKKKKLPKSFDEDGLADLIGNLGDSDDNEDGPQRKKVRLSKDEEDWLRNKHRKAIRGDEVSSQSSTEDSIDEDFGSEEQSVDELGDFEGFDDDNSTTDDEDLEEAAAESRQRENPYLPPHSSRFEEKYIPPSLRKPETSNTEELERLRRQIQGTVNRLSAAKVLSIASDIDRIYRENPRQHVSKILLDALFALICDPSPLQDTFMILHGGFVAALYKTIGTEFGAQVIQRFVEEYDRLSAEYNDDDSTAGKSLSNMVTFLAELYNFQVIGSPLIYDMIRILTKTLTEQNAELLLRIARISGFQLRQDDPASLKDITNLLHESVKRQGAENLSIRTKFMIETIENLRNKKAKTGVAASEIRTEHTTSMKKILGSMNRNTIKATEPLRIGLQDIRNSDKRGKWWLIGASFHDIQEPNESVVASAKKHHEIVPTGNGILDDDVDLNQLAREQGMNTDVRRAVFITIVSALNPKHACMMLDKLGLKSKQKFEIPKIIVHLVGAEKKFYNPYYTKIAKQLCGDRDTRKSFSFTLWDIFRRIEDDEEEEEDGNAFGSLDVTAIVYTAKMYGELVADKVQDLLLLKHADLAHPNSNIKTFLEVFLVTIFQRLDKKYPKDGIRKVKEIFNEMQRMPETIASLQLFLKKRIRSTKLLQDQKEKDGMKKYCKVAEGVLVELMSNGAGLNELSELM